MSRRKEKIAVDQNGSGRLSSNPFAGALSGLDGSGLAKASSTPSPAKPASEQSAQKWAKSRVEVRRLKAGKGGKTVTEVTGFVPAFGAKRVDALVATFKQQFGCGGRRLDNGFELQGDRVEAVLSRLAAEGFRPVQTGG